MTAKKTYTQQITLRFLEAIDHLATGKGMAKISEAIGMTQSNISRLRKNTDTNAPTLEACARMCSEYKVSATWLLTGAGDMLADDQLQADYRSLHKKIAEMEKIADAIKGKAIKIKRSLAEPKTG